MIAIRQAMEGEPTCSPWKAVLWGPTSEDACPPGPPASAMGRNTEAHTGGWRREPSGFSCFLRGHFVSAHQTSLHCQVHSQKQHFLIVLSGYGHWYTNRVTKAQHFLEKTQNYEVLSLSFVGKTRFLPLCRHSPQDPFSLLRTFKSGSCLPRPWYLRDKLGFRGETYHVRRGSGQPTTEQCSITFSFSHTV